MFYSFDTEDLINELSKDIAEFGNEEVWAYWFTVDNGIKIYFDYFPLDDSELINDPEYKTVDDFDQAVAKKYKDFSRKKMLANDLLEIFKQENKTINQKAIIIVNMLVISYN